MLIGGAVCMILHNVYMISESQIFIEEQVMLVLHSTAA